MVDAIMKMVGEVNLWEVYKVVKKARLMDGIELDVVLAPLGMMVLLVYHLWLLLAIKRNPRRTVIGLNAESRRLWVFSMMAVSIYFFFSLSALFDVYLISLFVWLIRNCFLYVYVMNSDGPV